MRNLPAALGTLLVTVFSITSCTSNETASAMPEAHSTAPVEGVFEYVIEGRKGLSFYHEGYWVHFQIPDGIEVAETGVTEEQMVQLWSGMLLNAGTYTMAGDTCTNHVLYHKNPTQIGDTFRWVGDFSSDTLTWSVIDEEGAVTSTGRSVRLR